MYYDKLYPHVNVLKVLMRQKNFRIPQMWLDIDRGPILQNLANVYLEWKGRCRGVLFARVCGMHRSDKQNKFLVNASAMYLARVSQSKTICMDSG